MSSNAIKIAKIGKLISDPTQIEKTPNKIEHNQSIYEITVDIDIVKFIKGNMNHFNI